MTEKVQMTNVTDVFIEKAILHVIDNSKEGQLELSDLPFDITPEKVNNFLKKHFIDSLRDDKIRKAKFNFNPENIVKNSCMTIINDNSINDDIFVEQSQVIAQYLYKFMIKGNISPGCLIVCKYKDNNGNPCISLMKMDYNDYYVYSKTKVGNKYRNDLIPRTNALPSIKQKLQKCAFVKEYNRDNTYDLIVLDKQPNKQEEEVALFFYSYFLDCTFCNDITSNTKAFFQKTYSFIREEYGQDPLIAKEKIGLLYNTMKSSDVFNANSFAELAFAESQSIKEKYLEEVIRKNDLEYESQIDKNYVENKLKRINITSTEGIEISLDSTVMDDKNTFQIEESTEMPGAYNIYIRNIHVNGKDFKLRR
jgi:hypothetical protein